jgi:hypothetical protein
MLTAQITQFTPTQSFGMFSGTFYNFNQELDRRKAIDRSQFFYTDNRKVYGTPFLYDTWEQGTIVMKNENVFTQYKIKYNCYQQALHFKTDKDSLVVEDEIVSFTINVKEDSLFKEIVFINSKQLGFKKKQPFLEKVYDDAFGTYVRLNSKEPTAVANTIAASSTDYVMDYRYEYYYYVKESQKSFKVKVNNSNWKELINDAAFTSREDINSELQELHTVEQVIVLLQKYKRFKDGGD